MQVGKLCNNQNAREQSALASRNFDEKKNGKTQSRRAVISDADIVATRLSEHVSIVEGVISEGSQG